jgi:hypothetical protein
VYTSWEVRLRPNAGVIEQAQQAESELISSLAELRSSMGNPLDISDLLRRGGEMTEAEVKKLAQEMTEAKLSGLSNGVSSRNLDQPVKIVPAIGAPPRVLRGYFTQQKFVWNETPQEMEMILGIFGKLREGAYILQFNESLKPGDYENRAYSYLPDGKEYKPNPNEKVYLPGKGAPQWVLTRGVQGSCIAHLKPNQVFSRAALKKTI